MTEKEENILGKQMSQSTNQCFSEAVSSLHEQKERGNLSAAYDAKRLMITTSTLCSMERTKSTSLRLFQG